jgi:hypothetical protein
LRIGVLLVLVCWPLVLYGGIRPSAALPWGFACLVSLLVVPPRFRSGIDAALIVFTGCLVLQLVPLPVSVIDSLAPLSVPLRDSVKPLPEHLPTVRPLSVRAPDSEWALVVMLGAIALFWTARGIFSAGGVRRTVRALTMTGLALAILAVVAPLTGGHLAVWRALAPAGGLEPFGPFANRNHFAAWTIMAIPLGVGYLASRSAGSRRTDVVADSRGWHAAPDVLSDSRGVRVGLATLAMIVALGVSRSISGVLALGVSAVITFAVVWWDGTAVRRGLLALGALTAAGAAAGWVRIVALPLDALPAGIAFRVAVWREAIPLALGFWAVGTGAGTYGAAMFLQRHGERGPAFAQAHNQYLQTAVEGGLLLAIPAAVAIGLFVRAAARALRADTSSSRWIRAGAACGLGALAIQCLWESSLTLPANAGLAAVLAAILVHQPAGGRLAARMANGKRSMGNVMANVDTRSARR